MVSFLIHVRKRFFLNPPLGRSQACPTTDGWCCTDPQATAPTDPVHPHEQTPARIGTIIGGILGGLVLAIISCCLCRCCRCRRRASQVSKLVAPMFLVAISHFLHRQQRSTQPRRKGGRQQPRPAPVRRPSPPRPRSSTPPPIHRYRRQPRPVPYRPHTPPIVGPFISPPTTPTRPDASPELNEEMAALRAEVRRLRESASVSNPPVPTIHTPTNADRELLAEMSALRAEVQLLRESASGSNPSVPPPVVAQPATPLYQSGDSDHNDMPPPYPG